MSKFYVGSEIGQLRRVLVHRPRRALTHQHPLTVTIYYLMTYWLLSAQVKSMTHLLKRYVIKVLKFFFLLTC